MANDSSRTFEKNSAYAVHKEEHDEKDIYSSTRSEPWVHVL